jgi:hypothetical protein
MKPVPSKSVPLAIADIIAPVLERAGVFGTVLKDLLESLPPHQQSSFLFVFVICASSYALHLAQSDLLHRQQAIIAGLTAILHKQRELDSRYSHRRKYDDDNQLEQTRNKRKKYAVFDRDRAERCLKEDFLGPERRFDNKQFIRTFRITPSLAEDILQKLAQRNPIFTRRTQVTGREGISPDVRLLCVLKCLGYGVSSSSEIPYFQMCETTIRDSIKAFARCMIDEYSTYYLRQPSKDDAKRVLRLHEEKHGAPGMFGSLDCMHVGWKNCPIAHQGQYSGKNKKPTLVLEAACDWNLWFWHVAFGYPGTLNDINIWDRSCLLRAFLSGEWSKNVDQPFKLNGVLFNELYLLGKSSDVPFVNTCCFCNVCNYASLH